MADQLKVLVVGGSGGIGQGIIRQILRRTPEAIITATWHSTQPDFRHANLHWCPLDATNEAQIQQLAEQHDALDWIVNTAGFLHSSAKSPEKTIKHFDTEFYLHTLSVNTLPTLLIAKHFGAKLRHSKRGVFASISAKVGSISDNQLGGWLSYRSSKAALNMIIKTLAIEWQRQMKYVCVVALHPGTTNTALSKPFQANVPANKLFSTERTASLLTDLMAGLRPEDSGKFLSWDGSVIPW